MSKEKSIKKLDSIASNMKKNNKAKVSRKSAVILSMNNELSKLDLNALGSRKRIRFVMRLLLFREYELMSSILKEFVVETDIA